MALLRSAARRYGTPRVEITVFGARADDPGLNALPHDFDWQLAGMLRPTQVARLLNDTEVFVDLSSHQAMGLTAMEAMACGAAVTVPLRGGAVSYAHDGQDCLVVDTSSWDACWSALRRLIEDSDLRANLQRQAIADICEHYPERPALGILRALFGTGAKQAAGPQLDAAFATLQTPEVTR